MQSFNINYHQELGFLFNVRGLNVRTTQEGMWDMRYCLHGISDKIDVINIFWKFNAIFWKRQEGQGRSRGTFKWYLLKPNHQTLSNQVPREMIWWIIPQLLQSPDCRVNTEENEICQHDTARIVACGVEDKFSLRIKCTSQSKGTPTKLKFNGAE